MRFVRRGRTAGGVAGVAVVLLAAAGAAADILYLKNGGRIEGVVREEGDVFVVESLSGTARVRRGEVSYRQSMPYVTEIYAERRARIRPGDAEGFFALARFCRENGLRREEQAALRSVVEISPDHAEARALLGEVKHRGEWLPRAAARTARLREAGFREVGGKYLTPAGLSALLAVESERARVAEEAGRRLAVREEEALRRRLLAEQMRRAEVEREAAERAAVRAEEAERERARLERENAELRELVRDLLGEEDEARPWLVGWALPAVVAPAWLWYPASTAFCRYARTGPIVTFGYDGRHLRVRGLLR